jgi:galactokinase
VAALTGVRPMVLYRHSVRGHPRCQGHQGDAETAPRHDRDRCRQQSAEGGKPVTSPSPRRVRVSTPGRICLFGEHQDYLGLPVIACAISLRISIKAILRNDRSIRIDLPDIGRRENIELDRIEGYSHERDYFRSGLRVMQQAGFAFPAGFDCTVHGEIPIQAGTSSSSALVVSWIHLLSCIGESSITPDAREIARLAHRAEVIEFHEPGGSMDQYTTALGSVLHLGFFPSTTIDPLPPVTGRFVLGDSGEPKDTKTILSKTKERILGVVRRLQATDPDFSLQTVSADDVGAYRTHLTDDDCRLLRGTIRNRDFTREARLLMASGKAGIKKFGELLTAHQEVLRDVLGISTRKIDRMLDAACNAGSPGGKINGSGGGGCMFVYAPEREEEIAEAIEREGGKSYIVTVAPGTTREL